MTVDGEECLLPFRFSNDTVLEGCEDLLGVGVAMCPYLVMVGRVPYFSGFSELYAKLPCSAPAFAAQAWQKTLVL